MSGGHPYTPWRSPCHYVPMIRETLHVVPEGAGHLALRVSVGNRLALVIRLAPARDRQLQFRAPSLEIQPQRHERETLLLGLGHQLLDLIAMEQQLARPRRLVVEAVALCIGSDV